MLLLTLRRNGFLMWCDKNSRARCRHLGCKGRKAIQKTFSTTWQCTTSCNPQSHLYCFVAQVILCLHLYHIYSPTTIYVNQWVGLKRQWSRSRRCSSAEMVFHWTITSYWDQILNSFGSLVSIKAVFGMTRKFWFLAVCFYSTLTYHMWKKQGNFDFSFH